MAAGLLEFVLTPVTIADVRPELVSSNDSSGFSTTFPI